MNQRTIDRCETQVGDFVELPQRSQDRQSISWAGTSAQPESRRGVLDLLSENRQLVVGDRASLTCFANSTDDLVPAERLDHPGALHDIQRRHLDRGEPSLAVRALSATSHRSPIVGQTAVYDPSRRRGRTGNAWGLPTWISLTVVDCSADYLGTTCAEPTTICG